jgi:3-phenylpropionate/trans-cinnamate dioxygenase ferredoxin reductase subunit
MIVIAGGGLAAQRCCERLRRKGYDGQIKMVCDEPHAPYDRPPLSKEYLAGKMTAPPRLRPDGWHADNAVDLLLDTRATALRSQENELELAGGQVLRYDQLLVATGAAPRVLPGVEGFENVHVLRTVTDAERLRESLAPGVRLAVIGAGFIGQEVAATARSLGAEVTLIEAMPAPLAHIVGEPIGKWFAELHRREGVEVRTGVQFERLAGTRHAHAVLLADGSLVECDEIVVGVGVAPATDWLMGTPLRNGTPAIKTDLAGRTAIPNVFAAGDCTGQQHWEAAVWQGGAAALGMLGMPAPAPSTTSFWSDLYGTRINWLGSARDADAVEVDGDQERRDFAVTYRRNGQIVAGLLVGRPEALPELRRAVNRKESK